MRQQVVTVVGGSGFVGRYVVKLLAAAGYVVRVIARRPDSALPLKTSGSVGQIVLMGGDLARPETLAGKLDYSCAVINLAGILFESGRQQFASVQAHGAEKLAQMAKAAGAQRFVHMSALGVDKAAGSHYARSKLLGEKAVLAAFPEAAILRPSVIFGPEDHFFNRFAAMPVLPNIGGGKTKFQPVYAGDVASAIEACITRPDAGGHIYELGGPQVFTFREILDYIRRVTGRKKPIVNIPFGIAPALASLAELVYWLNPLRTGRGPALTRDQVKLLRYDNIVGPNALGFAQLGVSPAAVDMIVPDYLALYGRHPIQALVAP